MQWLRRDLCLVISNGLANVSIIGGSLQVIGETRYMKIQKPGSATGVWKTPLNVRTNVNIKVAIAPPVSASGRAAINM